MSSRLPEVFEHPEPLHTLAPLLAHHLPNSFPLLRRIQSTYPAPAHVLSTRSPKDPHSFTNSALFSAAWVQHVRGPETQCWIFSSFEAAALPSHGGPTDLALHGHAQEARSQLLAILHAIADLNLPLITNAQNGDPPKLDIAPNQLIVGSVPLPLIALLAGREKGRLPVSKVLKRGFHAHRSSDAINADTGTAAANWDNVLCSISVAYVKYLISPPQPPRSTLSPHSTGSEEPLPLSLPLGYQFSSIKHSELSLVVAATEIPRQISTLAKYGSVGVRYHRQSAANQHDNDHTNESDNSPGNKNDSGQLIGWAFLAPDGSLSSLHVEPAHRGHGVAKAICSRLFALLREDSRGMGFAALRPRAGIDDSGDASDTADVDSITSGEVQGASSGVVPPTVADDGVATQWRKDIRQSRGEGWMSADVAEDNAESKGVCKAVGGTEAWRVRWIAVDLQAVVESTNALLEVKKDRGFEQRER